MATRDGFQIEPAFIPTDAKVALVDALSACGYAKIEVTSFTSPKAIPMLRDAEEVMGRIQRLPDVDDVVLAVDEHRERVGTLLHPAAQPARVSIRAGDRELGRHRAAT